MYGYSYLIQIYSNILIIHFVIILLYLFFWNEIDTPNGSPF